MRFLPSWRKATWALVLWTGLAVLWIVVGWQNVDTTTAGQVGGAIGTSIVLLIWFIGFIVLGLVWLMSRPKNNVVVYGPSGQQVQVSEKEAARRVKQGWTYQR